MAPERHPVTGVPLNPILIERKGLNFDDAVTAWTLKLEGEKYANIAHRLGTNTHRLGEVFRAEKFPDAEHAARRLLSH